MEVYLAVPEGSAVPAGVHWYDPLEHALVTIGPPPRGEAPGLVLTGVPWRTGWRYRERGYRHVYWDSGTMLSQMLALADSAGIPAALYTRFPDARVGRLVGADGVHEWPVAVVALGDAAPSLEASGAPATGEVDAAPLEFPLVTEAQHAGDLDALGVPWGRGAPVEVEAHAAAPTETVVLKRGSMKLMDPSRGLSQEVFITCMRAAMRGIDLPHRVVVHDVDGLEPGVYRWPDLTSPARAARLRDEMYRIALDQGLARDAAFVAIGAAEVRALDDRGYREAQLASGIVSGRLHLLAYALGASASGMTFLDSDIPALLDEPLEAMLFTCVGVPEYTSATGGLPGAPTQIRMITPRL